MTLWLNFLATNMKAEAMFWLCQTLDEVDGDPRSSRSASKLGSEFRADQQWKFIRSRRVQF